MLCVGTRQEGIGESSGHPYYQIVGHPPGLLPHSRWPAAKSLQSHRPISRHYYRFRLSTSTCMGISFGTLGSFLVEGAKGSSLDVSIANNTQLTRICRNNGPSIHTFVLDCNIISLMHSVTLRLSGELDRTRVTVPYLRKPGSAMNARGSVHGHQKETVQSDSNREASGNTSGKTRERTILTQPLQRDTHSNPS